MEFNISALVRANIKELVPYSSARSEFKGNAEIFLDANENAYGSPLEENYNRYPDPYQNKLKERLSQIKGVPPKNMFIGNGSDEAIDLLYRIFCVPGKDNVIICPPTYGMYEVSANINDVQVLKVPLTPEDFQLNVASILESINDQTKLIFVCCPNNPTGNGVKWNDIKVLLENFKGIVVVDEAYINFAKYRSLIPELLNYPNLLIMQTLSKAWGLAGLRVGLAFASSMIIELFNRVKPPYNISQPAQEIALKALQQTDQVNEWIRLVVRERDEMAAQLKQLKNVLKVYDSDANFLLVKVTGADELYQQLVNKGIITRNRSKVELCDNCLRITIGTTQENEKLMNALRSLES